MLNSGFDYITALDKNNAPDYTYAGIAGGMGAPTAISSLLDFAVACKAAIDAFNNEFSSKAITGILPIESGPVNGLLAIYIAFKYKYRLYDCDGAGRAVPSLSNLLYSKPFSNVNYSPSAAASMDGKQTSTNNTWTTGAEAEEGLRPTIDKLGGAVGITAWAYDSYNLANTDLYTGTYSNHATIGKNLKTYYTDKVNLYAYLESLAPKNSEFENLLLDTHLVDVVEESAAGYDKGYIVFNKEGDNEYRLYYLNENMFIAQYNVKDNSYKYVATAPSTITMFIYDSNPNKDLGLEAGYIPYNTGDLKTIKTLKGNEMIVSVTPPTCLLYGKDQKQSFVNVLNSYFNDDNFSFTISDIIPADCK
ncbi:hypothetical protein TXIAM_240049 [Tenacibaculum xiamenense]